MKTRIYIKKNNALNNNVQFYISTKYFNIFLWTLDIYKLLCIFCDFFLDIKITSIYLNRLSDKVGRFCEE